MEIDHLLALNDAQMLATYEDEAATLEQLRLWINTPRGTRWGDSAWGNTISNLNHEPVSTTLEVTMQNVIMRELPENLPNLQLSGIRVSLVSKDEAEIFIYISSTEYKITYDRTN